MSKKYKTFSDIKKCKYFMRAFLFGLLLIVITFSISHQSCTHDPFLLDEIDPNPIDTMVVDTMIIDTIVGTPCDSTIVYFERDILPILVGSCAFSGCHNAMTAQDGVILDSYDNVFNTADVKPFDLDGSDLYEVITENDPDDVMPPSGKLDNDKINLIALWILQGAENLFCDEEVDCVSENVSYNNDIKDIFSTSCNGCHSTTVAFGDVILDTYQGVKAEVNGGNLFGAINWDPGFSQMPQDQDQLDSCTIVKIKAWIDEGAQNN